MLVRRARSGRSGGASPAARHVAINLHAAALHPTRTRPSPRSPDYKCGCAHVDAAKVAGEVAKAGGKVAKVTKVAIHNLHTRDEACPRGIAPSTARSDRSSH